MEEEVMQVVLMEDAVVEDEERVHILREKTQEWREQ
jgi:hypothetical protein